MKQIKGEILSIKSNKLKLNKQSEHNGCLVRC